MAMYQGMSKENPDKFKAIADKSKLFNEFNQIFDSSLDIYSRVSFDTPLIWFGLHYFPHPLGIWISPQISQVS